MGATRASDIERQEWPGMGSLGSIADSSDRILGDLFFAPGDAFNFHHHPNQEEVLYVTLECLAPGRADLRRLERTARRPG